MDITTTTLYRYYDSEDRLLYVGITNSVPRRMDQHDGSKPWYTDACKVTMEHHSSRHAALEAEKTAIRSEKPRYNIRHNQDVIKAGVPRWAYQSRNSGFVHQVPGLWLYPELDCSACVDDVWEKDGESQLEYYIDYLEHQHQEWLTNDAVPIYWSVQPVCEHPPFASSRGYQISDPGNNMIEKLEHFLTFFTWPVHIVTGERLDWFQLPVRNDRFPEFAKALGWVPSPMQPYCPLRSVLESRRGAKPGSGI